MVKINMMCGASNFGPEWIHVDRNTEAAHICSNDIMRSGMSDNSVDLLYCSHGIAYFDREEIKGLLSAWFRILKSGAVLKLATPDWDILRTLPRPLLGPLYGKMSDPPIYHKTVYNYDELYQVLRAAGFIKIQRCTLDFGMGDQSDVMYDDKSISLKIMCYKP